MAIAGTLPPIRAVCLFPAQLLAAMCAGGLVQAMFPSDIGGCNTTLEPNTTVAQGVFIEMFMTAELVFVVLMLAAEKSKDTFLAPIGIGLSLFVAMMGGMTPFSSMCFQHYPRLIPHRRLLHRRFSQPSPKLWSRRCVSRLPHLPLDLLGWSFPRSHDRCWFLPIRQVL
jgi:hypothetical protein